MGAELVNGSLLVAAVVLFAALVVVERRARNPLVNMTALANPPVALTNVASLFVGFALFASFVGTSLALAIDVLLANRLVALPTALSVVGVGLLLMASVNLVREAHAALRSNRLEIAFFRDLQARRVAEARCPEG